MIYPDFIKPGDTIACTAVSDGVGEELDKKRFEHGRDNLKKNGYDVIFTDNVFTADKWYRSSEGSVRGKEFNQLFDDDKVKAIVAAKGGNFLCEMLEYIDFDKVKNNPKWFQGYSDNTCLVHALTTKCDIATVYGNNFGDFGAYEWDESVRNHMNILTGKKLLQTSYKRYQHDRVDSVTGLEGYNYDRDVDWKINKEFETADASVTFSGRLIGGCMDVLRFLQGTRYDGTLEFIEKYKNDGIIWYLETFDYSGETLMMDLWKFKEVGWFKYVKGFIFGRPLFFRNFEDANYTETVEYILKDLNVPIIYDCDFGHRGPRFAIVNGAVASVVWNPDHTGSMEFEFK